MTDSHHRHRRAFGRHGPKFPLEFSPTKALDLSLPTLDPGLVTGVQIVPPGIASLLGLSTQSTVSTSITPLEALKGSTSTTKPTSTTGTTSTTSTTRSTTTTSSTSKSTSQTVTSNTPAAHVTSASITKTNLVTIFSTSSSSSSARPSATGVALASSGMGTGVVVGGIGAGIVAAIALILAITFFLRRSRKRDDFDAQEFRRSAMIINDPPIHEDTMTLGFNPRPPSMIERRLASPAPSFGTQYGAPGPAYNHGNEYSDGHSDNHAGFGSYVQSHTPGQVMNYGAVSSNSIYQFAPAIHNQSPFSPVHAPISPFSEQHDYDQQSLPGQPPMETNGATYPVLTRQPSSQSASAGHSPQLPPSQALQKESASVNDYVDLNRSSVSPFQAAQYVEISKKLNAEVPQGLLALPAERELPPLPPSPVENSGEREISPFADPESVPPSPGSQFAIDHRNLDPDPRPKSGGSMSSVTSNTLDFPVPPSPAYTVSSRYHIDSTPPTLPEIKVESRASVTRYSGLPNAGNGLSGGLSVVNQNLPSTPSPLASSFGVSSTPDVEETAAAAVDDESAAHSSTSPPASTAAPAIPNEKKRSTSHSMYNAEDAYGGI